MGYCTPEKSAPVDTAAILAKCKKDTIKIDVPYFVVADTNKILAMYCDTIAEPIDTDTLFRGMYLNGFANIVGNTMKEEALLYDLKYWKINAIYSYNLSSVLETSKEPALASLHKRMKAIGIKEVGGARGNSSSCTGAATKFNKAYSDSSDFDCWNLEFEAYNAYPKIGGGYTFDKTQSTSTSSTEAARALAWADNLRYLQEMKAGKTAGQVKYSVQYWGWYKTPFVTDAPKAIVGLTDYAIVHDYEKVPSFSYTESRCTELDRQAGLAGKIMTVRVLFSSEPDFMQPWLKAGHTMDEAFYIWYKGFQAKKYKNLTSDGYVVFALDFLRVAQPGTAPLARMAESDTTEYLPAFVDPDFQNKTTERSKALAEEN